MEKTAYIYRLIAQGEHQQQDFKFEVSDARKIARTLSAFANTVGGRLLIGVKDNGKIAGIRSEEELYMIDAAARLYCKPQVSYETKNHLIEGKNVLEVYIPEGDQKPYYAQDHDNRHKAYLRIDDENVLASPVHIKVWQTASKPEGIFVRYTESEERLMDHLNKQECISINQYSRLAAIPRNKAIHTLAKFVRFGIISPLFKEGKFLFTLSTPNS